MATPKPNRAFVERRLREIYRTRGKTSPPKGTYKCHHVLLDCAALSDNIGWVNYRQLNPVNSQELHNKLTVVYLPALGVEIELVTADFINPPSTKPSDWVWLLTASEPQLFGPATLEVRPKLRHGVLKTAEVIATERHCARTIDLGYQAIREELERLVPALQQFVPAARYQYHLNGFCFMTSKSIVPFVYERDVTVLDFSIDKDTRTCIVTYQDVSRAVADFLNQELGRITNWTGYQFHLRGEYETLPIPASTPPIDPHDLPIPSNS